MPRISKRLSTKYRMPPGSLIHVGEKYNENLTIEVFDYNTENFKYNTFKANQMNEIKSLPPLRQDMVRWINVDSLFSVEAVEWLCNEFNIHFLVTEDILNTSQRPKIEEYDGYLYIVSKMLYFSGKELINEQLSIIVGENYVITFGEKKGDVFDVIRDSIEKNGHIRKFGADYLAYSILDAVVDGYFNVLESLGDKIESVEEELLSSVSNESLLRIQDIRKDLLYMHKSILPLREVISWMEKSDNKIILKQTKLYIRDLYDHIIHSVEITESFRELLAGLTDIYLSGVNNRMNDIMKVLTIISTIFIPLSFIAGVYGMNFKYMPELGWKWGYGSALILMAAIAAVMIMYFKKKKWF